MLTTIFSLYAKNQNSAWELRKIGHRLTVAKDYAEALQILEKETFDVVLLDLHMPMVIQGALASSALKLGEQVPYGALLIWDTALAKAKRVAVVTDLNHHSDPFSAAYDRYTNKVFMVNETLVRMIHAPMSNGAKDWVSALSTVLSSRVE